MINRYSTISEKDFNLYVPPIEAIGAALETAQKTYDTNFMFANELKNKYINARPQDRARANELQTGWENQVNDLVKKYNGDFSTASKDLYLLQKDIEKQYRQGGEANAIETNYNLLADSKKRNQERLAKGEITETQYGALYRAMENDFTGTKKLEDGTYGLQNIPELAKYVDSYKLADEATKGLKPRTKKETVVSKDANGFLRYDTREISAIDPQEVQDAIQGATIGNEQYYNYAEQLGKLLGIDPASIMDAELQANTRALGPTRSGVFNQSSDLKLEADPFALAKQKHQYSLAEEANRQRNRVALAKAKGEIETPDTIPNIRLIGSINNEQSKYKPIGNLADGIQAPTATNVDYRANIGGEFTPRNNTVLRPTVKTSVADVLNQPQKFTNVNHDLLRSIKAQNPKYTDIQILDQYNRSLPSQNNNEGVYVTAYRNSDTGLESAKLILPQLIAGNAKVVFVGADGKRSDVPSDKQQEYASLIQDRKIGAVGQSRSFSGNVPVGETFPVPGGYIIVSSNSVGLNQYNEYMRDDLFGFIGEGRAAGERVPLADGKFIQGVSMPKQKPDPNTGLPITVNEIAFVSVDENGNVIMKNGQPDFYTHDGRLANPADIEDKILGGGVRLLDTPKKVKSATKDYNNYYEE